MRCLALTFVLSLAAGTVVPAGQEQDALKTFTIEGQPGAGTATVEARTTAVAPSYFREERLPLVRGRLFTDRDSRNSPLVVIVSESMAARAWPNLDPIGRRVKLGEAESKSNWMTVIGVVADSKRAADLPAQPYVYSCSLQSTSMTPTGR